MQSLTTLYTIIATRRKSDPESSYTARLFQKGRAKIAQKVGEEAVETVIEGIRDDKKKLAEESADLLYHLLVLWADAGVKPDDIEKIITDRMNAVGDEKKRRKGGE
jgi:phosphoribosyl-ATP pyrophosphohydrolase